MIDETPEAVFFRYSAGCAYQLFNLGRITKQDYDEIKNFRARGEIPDRAFLEKVYPVAIERIKRLATSLGRDYWSIEIIKKYFLEEHNRVIDRGEGYYAQAPDVIKELCKVRVGIVTGKEDRGFIVYTVDFGGREEKVVGKYLPNAKKGDKISAHWKEAVDIIR
ncbi:hypothetical protein FJZ19_03065 [Candidatus Pacearchaeota archaeon]|nr:hypothetical protein [Candidatus Pacearchaeota archaeon]